MDGSHTRNDTLNIELHAERAVSLFAKEIPANIRHKPEGLAGVDFHFWRSRYPETFKRPDIDAALVPAIGGFIGRMLARQLGGRWVPRQNLDETQVDAGARAWLPFLRAKHYLQSTQSIVDHSLTQFFRMIALHHRAR